MAGRLVLFLAVLTLFPESGYVEDGAILVNGSEAM